MKSRQLAIIFSLLLTACGATGGDDAPVEELGMIATGGKADDPIVTFDIDLGPGELKELNFESTGDLDVALFQSQPAALAKLKLWSPDNSSSVEVTHLDEFGRNTEPVPSTAPRAIARTYAGEFHRYQVVVRNTDDSESIRGKLLFSRPSDPATCESMARPSYTFDPIARCGVVSAGKLQDESHVTMKYADLCVGTGEQVDGLDGGRETSLGVLGVYGIGEPDDDFLTQAAELNRMAPVDQWDETAVSASYRASFDVVEREYTFAGEEERRENREFEYTYRYDLERDELQIGIKSRPQIFPNWFWELEARLSCERLDGGL